MSRTKYPIFKCLRRGQKGFTLIELLVVIAILGVIAAVAIPNITQFMGAGEEEARLAELHNVQVAASAALYQATVDANATANATSLFVDYGGTALTPPVENVYDPAHYLINKTVYKYTIDGDTGAVNSTGEKAP